MDIPIYNCSGKIIEEPCYAEIKYDGEYYVWKNGVLNNKRGKEKPFKELECLPPCVLVGELYFNEGKWGQLYELLANKNSHELKYVVFDIVSLEGNSLTHKSYEERRYKLEWLFDTYKDKLMNAHLIKRVYCDEYEDVKKTFDDAVKEGYEGVVLKAPSSYLNNENTTWIKMKRILTNDLEVVSIDKISERIDVRLREGDTTGVKCPHRFKRRLKVGDIVEIQHNGVLVTGGLRHPTYVRARPDKTEGDVV